MKTVGVLALQGDFAAHVAFLEQLGARAVEVRSAEQLLNVDGLIIPGGESTTMLKLLRYDRMMEPLGIFLKNRPVFGTCAGAILLAAHVTHPEQESFSALDIDVQRNGYGRQNDSRVTNIETTDAYRGNKTETGGPNVTSFGGAMEAVFIRAPIIRRTGQNVIVLASYLGNAVLVEEGQHMAATFHPELTQDPRVHKHFLSKIG